MGTVPTTTIRIDPEVKKNANLVFGEIGIGMSAAVNAFLKAVVREQRMPFEMKTSAKSRRTSGNTGLNRAYLARKDEFYTTYEDVEKEVTAYSELFRGKVVLCNCDDPFESAFFRFFLLHFNEYGLEKLISVCYCDSPVAGEEYPLEEGSGAYKAVVSVVPDVPLVRPDGSLDLESVLVEKGNYITWLSGDGDFRSEECKQLLNASDIVVTNPPFSLFREFIAQLEEYGKDYIILGNLNASTYKEVFPLFQNDRVWYGQSIRSGDRKFYVPDSYPLRAADCGIEENSNKRYIKVKGVRWFTNMDNGRRHEMMSLTAKFDPARYPKYDNYNAIEVARTADIPADYSGVMGVPITFLDKYNPEQFEIVMLANGNARTNVDPAILDEVGYRPNPEDRGGVGLIAGKRSYARILLRRRGA